MERSVLEMLSDRSSCSDSAGVQAISTEKPRTLLEKIPIINKEQFLIFTPWKKH